MIKPTYEMSMKTLAKDIHEKKHEGFEQINFIMELSKDYGIELEKVMEDIKKELWVLYL